MVFLSARFMGGENVWWVRMFGGHKLANMANNVSIICESSDSVCAVPADFVAVCASLTMSEPGNGVTYFQYRITKAGQYNLTVLTAAGEVGLPASINCWIFSFPSFHCWIFSASVTI